MPDSESSPFRRRLRPKTYSIGLYLVGFFILFQIVALFAIFWFGRLLIQSEDRIISGKTKLELEGPNELVTSLSNLPRPEIVGRLQVNGAESMQSNVRRFIEDARRYRREGDFNLAEAALQEALKRDSENVLALTHFALLEEARENTQSALEYWQKIIAAQPADAVTLQLAKDRASIIEERIQLEIEADRRAEVLENSRRVIILSKVETDPKPLPADPPEIQKDFILKKNNQNVSIDPGQVRIQLFFYDRLTDGRLIRSPIDAQFLSESVDWEERPQEVLRARYFKSGPLEGQERTYYGYLLRIFYEDELQDEHASPVSLLRIFPST
jgi:tetratricopeptide (TPR) repeat protein